MDPSLAAGLALVLLFALYLRGDRKAARKAAAEQRELLDQVLEEVTSLRSVLVAGGAVEAVPASPPAVQPPALPAAAPALLGGGTLGAPAATEAPPVAGEAGEEPPSTKPSQSRKVPAPGPRSAPRPVPFEDQVQRALGRLARQLSPDVEARWLERLRALAAELGLSDAAAPTDEQVEAMIRELYQAEADVKDVARPSGCTAPAAEATLPSAVAPIAVRIAAAAGGGSDADGDVTLRDEGARRTVLPRANVDEEGDGRDTAEELTKVYSRGPGEADAGLPGVEVKPRPSTARPPPHKPPRRADPLAGAKLERPTSSPTRTAEEFQARRGRPTLLGGLVGPIAPNGDQEGGDGR
jgi:hypothetical protein